MKQLAIIGAGGHGKVVADAAVMAGWANIVFFDDMQSDAQQHLIWPIGGKVEHLLNALSQYDGICVAIGNNQNRLELCQRIISLQGRLVHIIHPTAVVSPHAQIGAGTVVFAQAVINPCAKIGIACIINTAATVDHDCTIGRGVHISPGVNLAGNVAIGERSWIGIGACVKHNITIGRQVMVGAGAAVVANVTDGKTVVGIPAKERIVTHA